MSLPARASVVEVGPRDGFQMEATFIPTQTKVAIINALAAAGVNKIETTSFVSPAAIPQMKDAAEVMQRIDRRPGVAYTTLVPNVTGARLAVQAGVDGMRLVVCATESYNQRNVHMSIQDSFSACEEIVAVGADSKTPVEVAIGLAFGCPLEGRVSEDTVEGMTRELIRMGVKEISIADSVGLANPAQVRRLMARLLQAFPDTHFSLHLHNTRGLGLANVVAALGEGVDTFDSSVGGLGGCPMVPGGSGNIPTEDLVHMLNEMGIETGVDVDSVLAASRIVGDFLKRALPSYVLAAGTCEQIFRRAEDTKKTGAIAE